MPLDGFHMLNESCRSLVADKHQTRGWARLEIARESLRPGRYWALTAWDSYIQWPELHIKSRKCFRRSTLLTKDDES